MTLSQLRTFALVARLGSMRAAALELGVSEPAVSGAIAALRASLDDPLVVRADGGIALTAGGRRLAAHADEIVGLADRARREVAAAGTSGDLLRVLATPAFAEHAAGALVDAFTRRSPGTAIELVTEDPERLGSALVERSADVVLGTRPTTAHGVALEVVPFLRYQRVLVAAATHPLALSVGAGGGAEARAGAGAAPAVLMREPWLTGPAGVEEHTEEGRWLAGRGVLPRLVYRASETEALAAVLAGEGVMLALAHVVRAELRRGALVRLPVGGTPVHGLWCATTLGHSRAPAAAHGLQRFTTTPDATAAMVAPVGAPRGARPLPPVHVALWS